MKYIIDTDPGTDDILALCIAINKLDVALISTMGGNVPIDHTTQNALDIVHWFKKDIPVAKGNQNGLLGFRFTSETWLMGKNGICDYEFAKSPKKAIEGDVVDVIYKSLISGAGKTTIVAIAPLTNVAKLLIKYPAAKSRIEEIIIMGGTIHQARGNVTEHAEYNFHSDADAAKFVLESKIPTRIFPLELGHTADLNEDELAHFAKLGNRTGKMLYDILNTAWTNITKTENKDRLMEGGLAVHDVFVMLYLCNNSLFKFKKANISVCNNHYSYNLGETNVRFDNENSHIQIAYYFEKDEAKKLLFDIVKELD